MTNLLTFDVDVVLRLNLRHAVFPKKPTSEPFVDLSDSACARIAKKFRSPDVALAVDVVNGNPRQ